MIFFKDAGGGGWGAGGWWVSYVFFQAILANHYEFGQSRESLPSWLGL